MDLSPEGQILEDLGRTVFQVSVDENTFAHLDEDQFVYMFRMTFQNRVSANSEDEAISAILNIDTRLLEYFSKDDMSRIINTLGEMAYLRKVEREEPIEALFIQRVSEKNPLEEFIDIVNDVQEYPRKLRLNSNINIEETDANALISGFARVIHTLGGIEDDVIRDLNFEDFLKLFKNLIDPESTLNITIASEMTLYLLDLIDEFIGRIILKEGISPEGNARLKLVTPNNGMSIKERLKWLRRCIRSFWEDNNIYKVGGIPYDSSNAHGDILIKDGAILSNSSGESDVSEHKENALNHVEDDISSNISEPSSDVSG